MPNRYVVHGTDRDSKQRVRKLIEAPSAPEAEAIAFKLGVDVLGSEIDTDPAGTPTPAGGPEETVWTGSPSLWSQFWWFAGAGLLVVAAFALGIVGAFAGAWLAIPIAFLVAGGVVAFRVLLVRSRRYSLTNQRLRLESGLVARQVEEVELYRIIDTAADQGILQRLLRVGTVVVVSNDERNPQVSMPWVHAPRDLREKIRHLGEARRRWRKVAEIDIS
ncbi:MAG: hypothetical protein FJ255_02955 [Phycisphaerae bacterium]|nr:hypothetical protein [Phycisphaerae bacterium]